MRGISPRMFHMVVWERADVSECYARRFLESLRLWAASLMSDAAIPPTTIPGIMKEKIKPM